jgi:hypothetical protein
MSAAPIHVIPGIYPSPYGFRPERWLNNANPDQFLVSFSKGSRQCSGINLAYAELYICLASIFRVYDGPGGFGTHKRMELFRTTEEDVQMHHDMAIPLPAASSRGGGYFVRS